MSLNNQRSRGAVLCYVLMLLVFLPLMYFGFYYWMTRHPLLFLPDPFRNSMCVRGIMNGNKRTWRGQAKGATIWWDLIPAKFKQDLENGFEELADLEAAVDKYINLNLADLVAMEKSKNGKVHYTRKGCEAVTMWQAVFIHGLFYEGYKEFSAQHIDGLPHWLPIQLANTHADIFPVFGLAQDDYTTAWFAAYDLFGYPPADPKGEPLSPKFWAAQAQQKSGFSLLGGAIVGAVLAPVLLSAAGFTAAGVAAGSLAAGVQSAVYGGATTGAFSLLQSAGAGAVGSMMAVMGGTTFAGSVVAGGMAADAEDDKRTLK